VGKGELFKFQGFKPKRRTCFFACYNLFCMQVWNIGCVFW